MQHGTLQKMPKGKFLQQKTNYQLKCKCNIIPIENDTTEVWILQAFRHYKQQ